MNVYWWYMVYLPYSNTIIVVFAICSMCWNIACYFSAFMIYFSAHLIIVVGYLIWFREICLLYSKVNLNIWWMWSCGISPSGRSTVVSIVSCRCTYCCLETSHKKVTRHYSWYCTVAFCYANKCELSYVSWSWHKIASTPSEIISYRVCGIWLGICEGANVIISK